MNQNNVYELLYMSRQEDRYAFEALFQQFRILVARTAGAAAEGYLPLRTYREDIIQEGMYVFPRALDSYREDRKAAPLTYFQLVARRRVWNVCKRYSHGLGSHGEVFSLEEPITEDERFFDTIPQQDRLCEPEYVMHYHLAMENLDRLLSTMKEEDLDTARAMTTHTSYQECADKAGISYKAWDGRVLRTRRKIRKAVFKG